MSLPQQQPRRSRVPLIVALVLAGVGMLCVGLCAVFAVLDSDDDPAARPSAAARTSAAVPKPSTVDAADVAAYWSDNFEGASWWALASVPTWDGNVLTVKTTLFADADAVEPAKAMCVAASGYWFHAGREFESVRVVDSAGVVLVSRHVVGDQCTWRR